MGWSFEKGQLVNEKSVALYKSYCAIPYELKYLCKVKIKILKLNIN